MDDFYWWFEHDLSAKWSKNAKRIYWLIFNGITTIAHNIADQKKMFLIYQFIDAEQNMFCHIWNIYVLLHCCTVSFLNVIKFAIKRLNCLLLRFRIKLSKTKCTLYMCRSGGFIAYSLFLFDLQSATVIRFSNFAAVSKTWNHCGIHGQTYSRC